MDWVLGERNKWTPTNWAPDFLDEKMFLKILMPLQRYWNMDEEQIKQRLEHMSKQEMLPFVISLLTSIVPHSKWRHQEV